MTKGPVQLVSDGNRNAMHQHSHRIRIRDCVMSTVIAGGWMAMHPTHLHDHCEPPMPPQQVRLEYGNRISPSHSFRAHACRNMHERPGTQGDVALEHVQPLAEALLALTLRPRLQHTQPLAALTAPHHLPRCTPAPLRPPLSRSVKSVCVSARQRCLDAGSCSSQLMEAACLAE
jgi:hypothetical protein